MHDQVERAWPAEEEREAGSLGIDDLYLHCA